MDGEGGAAAFHALDLDASVVLVHDFLDDGESESGADFFHFAGVLSAEELGEELWHGVLGNADAGVADGEAEGIGLVAVAGDLDPSAGGRVFDGVGDEVLQELFDHVLVAGDLGEVVGGLDLEGGSFDLGLGGEGSLDPLHDHGEINGIS